MTSPIPSTRGRANPLPQELVSAMRKIYEPAGLKVTGTPVREAESAEYGACRLALNEHNIVFRVAKTTPTKVGQFVTIWQRQTPHSQIAPFDISDGISFVVVCAFDGTHRGQFVFDQEILLAKGVMSCGGNGGKRAIRVYPPWIKPIAKDAKKTQLWQLPYFFPIDQDGTADCALVRKLFAEIDKPVLGPIK